MKKKYVFISNMASPYQVKFCYSLQKYFDAEFWFYEYLDDTRPEWWKIPLGDKCKIMKASGKLSGGGLYSFGVFYELLRFKPDIVVLGGFTKWHALILKLSKMLSFKVAVMSEPLRFVNHDDDKLNTLMSKENSLTRINGIKKRFRNADLFIGMGEVASKQFVEEFGFSKDRVASTVYPMDIEEYYKHPLRDKQKGDIFKLLFANRLVDRYQPLFALQVYKKLCEKYSNLELYMNNEGSLKQECIDYIKKENLKNIHFINEIDSWNNMHQIYKNTDILFLPASYSNGNGTIIEARASGMGIVVSNRISNIEKHSVNGKNCFICDLDLDSFVKGIENYLQHPELLISHGQVSRTMVEYRKNESSAKLYYDLFKNHGLIE